MDGAVPSAVAVGRFDRAVRGKAWPMTTSFGLKLMSELHGPISLVEQAELAEDRDLDLVSISDHIHPWLADHDHSPFARSVLGAIAARTERIDLITGVTCPILRYHPVIVAQAAATVAVMSGGRLTLGLGIGERLNEHVTGAPFPMADVRHEMLAEAISIMTELWGGGFVTRRGRYFDADHVRIYDLPDETIPVVVAVSGDQAIAAAHVSGAAGIMATDPEGDLVSSWVDSGGAAEQTWCEVPMAWAGSDDAGLEAARRFRFGMLGWDVMTDIPNPKGFDAVTALIPDAAIGEQIPHGPDPKPYVAAVQEYLDAGFRKLAIVPVGDDIAGTVDFFLDEVRPQLELG